MRFQLSIITIVVMICCFTTQSASKYEDVSWNEKRNLRQAEFDINDKVKTSYFDNEFDATEISNQFCNKMGIPPQNFEICEFPNQQKDEKKSQYKSVYWHRERKTWYVIIRPEGKKQIYGGSFKNELDAAKRVHQLCKELKILPQNSSISAIPNQNFEKRKKTSQYKGVCWHRKMGKWYVQLSLKGEKTKRGGYFKDELDAGKKVNQLCEGLGIPLPNPEISAKSNQELQIKEKTSQFKGVCWHKKIRKWYVQLWLKNGKPMYGGNFEDELDAAKRVNQLCEESGITLQNPEISGMPNQKYERYIKTSEFRGVCWYKEIGKWRVLIHPKGKKPKFGGYFKDELDAAKKVNQLCEDLGIPLQYPEISAIPNQQNQRKTMTSQYKGVSWLKERSKWRVHVQVKGQKPKYGGIFRNELDAAKGVNQLCEQLGITPKNPEINAIPNAQYQKKVKSSQYKGVFWHREKRKWCVQLSIKGQKQQYGGYFEEEVDAARRINQLCGELGIPLQNPGTSTIPNQKYQKREKTSQYKGVYWLTEKGKWCVQLRLKGVSQYGGAFADELDAARKVNHLCKEFGIPLKNLEISTIPKEQYPKNCKTLPDHDLIKAELQRLIKILDENNDPTTNTIKENLIATITCEQSILVDINLCTKNGESALSIAAKYGFSNVVKFLISKGAEKYHFTNNHHTPLSLAVSQNHLKVVQVLFENWISPNSHEKPYLHLSPIFQVKSREIAQHLIDNDAVTHDIYNDKNQSPLTVACQNGYLDVVEFFLDDGLDINHLDCDNKTPLFYALTNNHEEVTKLLISKGAQN